VVARSGRHAAQTAQRLNEAAFCGSCQFDHAHGIAIGTPIQDGAGVEFKLSAQFPWHDRLAFGCNGARHGKNFQLLVTIFKHEVKRPDYRKASVITRSANALAFLCAVALCQAVAQPVPSTTLWPRFGVAAAKILLPATGIAGHTPP
jgi:hypothetical protein